MGPKPKTNWSQTSAKSNNLPSFRPHQSLCSQISSSTSFVFFQETKRPSKEMQVTIARQLGLDPSTVSNFFMNARRRSVDKWREDSPSHSPPPPSTPHTRMVLVTTSGGGPATVVQHIGGGGQDLSPTSLSGTSGLDLWQDLGGSGVGSPTTSGTSHTVYIIPRDRLVATAGGTLTVSTGSGQCLIEEDILEEDQVVLENHEEILETEEEVLDDDDCLENPPD